MNQVREICKQNGWKIVGRLRRCKDSEWVYDYDLNKVHSGWNVYMDDAGNEYDLCVKGRFLGGLCVLDKDGNDYDFR